MSWTVVCRCGHEKAIHVGTVCIGHKHRKACGSLAECAYGANCSCATYRPRGIGKVAS